jgi:hypothetical protein
VELYLKLKNSLVYLAIAAGLLLIWSSVGRANEQGVNGRLLGKKWNTKTVTLKKKNSDGVQTLVLEFFDNEISDSDICTAQTTSRDLLIEIPLNSENRSGIVTPDCDRSNIYIGENETQNNLVCYHELELNTDELNAKGLAYVSGKLQISRQKTNTDLSGTFKARVCNSQQNI